MYRFHTLHYLLRIVFLLIFQAVISQVGIGTTNPDPASVLDIQNSGTSYGGVRFPTLNAAQRAAIPGPIPDGMMIYYVENSSRCLQMYDAVLGIWQNIHCMNQAPVASNVTYSGNLALGNVLTSSFTYSDTENDPPGTHQYQWYRADDNSGTNNVAISGATNNTYTITNTDISKYIEVSVIPVATSGASPGTIAYSNYQGPVAAPPNTITFSQQNQSIYENASPDDIKLKVAFTQALPSSLTVTISSSDYTRLDESAPVNVTIPQGSTSPYLLTVFNAKDDAVLNGSSNLTMTITNVSGGTGSNTIGTTNTDGVTILDNEVQLTYFTDFANYAGQGFKTVPTSSQLDSDFWRCNGLTGGSFNYGATATTGEFARGVSNGGTSTAGYYAFNAGSGARIFGVKPKNYFSSGFFEFRLQNTTGATLTNFTISFNSWRYNLHNSSLGVSVSYSTDGSSYTNVPALNFSISGTSGVWSGSGHTTSITVNVPAGGYLYIKWFSANTSPGFSNINEWGIDNLNIVGKNF